jgi:ABC-type uncharacterized transport system substrate-binding protein
MLRYAFGYALAYGANYMDIYRRAATYVDRILRGEKPADLPVQTPTKFELVARVTRTEGTVFSA